MPKIIIDAGHGGSDAGDIYEYRYEKDDNLRLALEVGEILKNKYHFDVAYTRTNDSYLSQLDRVKIANSEGGDLLLSIHRIVGEIPSNVPSLGFYIYERDSISETMTDNIGKAMAEIDFPYYFANIRTDLPLLKETIMPTVMVNIGNLNSDIDNELFDTQLTAIAEAIAKGVAMSYSEGQETMALLQSRIENSKEHLASTSNNKPIPEPEYSIRLGEHSRYENAAEQQKALILKGYPAGITKESGGYIVLVGKYPYLETAVELERMLRQEGYATMIMA